MASPRKIRVLYFDESPDALERFVEPCGCKNIIDIIGAFRSFNEISEALSLDEYRFFKLLNPDVAVLRLKNADTEANTVLIDNIQKLKANCNVKLVGLLSAEYAQNRLITSALDYYTEEAGADSIITDEDAFTRLFYQIKTARLMGTAEKAGIKGRWAVLPLPPKPVLNRRFDVLAIGASAGGTDALTVILSALPDNLPPILVVQHMPDNFSDFFAKNLSSRIPANVVVARGGERLKDGTVYLAGGGKHLEITKINGEYIIRCTGGGKVSGHCPSVDVMFCSVAKAAGSAAIGIILTGMGSDGAQGLLEMRRLGAYTLGQNKETCAVYGMPGVAYALGAVSKQLPLESIARAIIAAVAQNGEERRYNE